MADPVRAPDGGLDDSERVDLLRALEELACTVRGEQAVLTAAFAASQSQIAAEADVRPDRRLRGVASQVALARRESPHRAGPPRPGHCPEREMPHILRAFRAGMITECQAQVILTETAVLTLEHRQPLDEELAGSEPARGKLEQMGSRQLAGQLRARAAALEPSAVARRRRRAENERHTSLRPAPDTMTWFGALLSVKDGVGLHAALLHEADRLRTDGDQRGKGQIMADTLVDRVLRPAIETGADRPSGELSQVPLMINLVVPDTALLATADDSEDTADTGWVEGYTARCPATCSASGSPTPSTPRLAARSPRG